jgi:hypothetical protein
MEAIDGIGILARGADGYEWPLEFVASLPPSR